MWDYQVHVGYSVTGVPLNWFGFGPESRQNYPYVTRFWRLFFADIFPFHYEKIEQIR